MLPLKDDRWLQLTTFFRDGRYLADTIGEWTMALGFDQEIEIYRQSLYDLFLHQGTITNAAFAIAPYLVDACARNQTQNIIVYLTDVGWIEANRLIHGLYCNRVGTAEYPEWIMNDYYACIARCPDLVDDVLEACKNKELRRPLAGIKPAFHGNGKLAWENR